jgi:predicted DNA-binding WGR domain protein
MALFCSQPHPSGADASGVGEGDANETGFFSRQPDLPGMTIELRACDRRRNRYRAWRVEAGRDLFGRWNARVTFGRIGCDGRTQRHDFDSEAATTAFVRACLRRRGTAERRLSVRYRVIDASPSALPLLRIFGLEVQPSLGPAEGCPKGLALDWPFDRKAPGTMRKPGRPNDGEQFARIPESNKKSLHSRQHRGGFPECPSASADRRARGRTDAQGLPER